MSLTSIASRPACAALGCRATASVTYEAGPIHDPYRTASACRRHRMPVRLWVADGGRVRRTLITASAGMAA